MHFKMDCFSMNSTKHVPKICSLKSIHHKVVCLLLRNAQKMTRQAALNGYTESEPFCVHLERLQVSIFFNNMEFSDLEEVFVGFIVPFQKCCTFFQGTQQNYTKLENGSFNPCILCSSLVGNTSIYITSYIRHTYILLMFPKKNSNALVSNVFRPLPQYMQECGIEPVHLVNI